MRTMSACCRTVSLKSLEVVIYAVQIIVLENSEEGNASIWCNCSWGNNVQDECGQLGFRRLTANKARNVRPIPPRNAPINMAAVSAERNAIANPKIARKNAAKSCKAEKIPRKVASMSTHSGIYAGHLNLTAASSVSKAEYSRARSFR